MPKVPRPLRKLFAHLLFVKGAVRPRPRHRNNFKHVARDKHRLVRLVACDEALLDATELTPDFAGAVLLVVQHDTGMREGERNRRTRV